MMNKYYKNNSMEMPHKMLVNFIDNNPDVKTVIDLGCGAGKDSRFLAKRNIKVTAIDRVDVTNFLYKGLEENERELITSRYYEDMTQKETAESLGITQVQVSRKESKILEKLKTKVA